MGRTQKNCSYQFRIFRYRDLIISLFLLLGSKLFYAEGRVISGTEIEAARAELQGEGGVVQDDGVETTRRWLIGSSPPTCERRCSSCRQCEAVQVPIVPRRGISRLFTEATPRIAYSRGGGGGGGGGNDISNYKPMTWKCKCGDLLFNP